MGSVMPLLLPLLQLLAVPPGVEQAFEARGGFALVDLAVPVAPPLPVFSGDVSWHSAPMTWLAWGARYRTHLGAVHRLGPEVVVDAPIGSGFSVGGRLFVSGSLAGAWQEDVDVAGDVATTAMASLAWHDAIDGDGIWNSLRVEGGATVEWLLWSHIAGRSAVDAAPYPAYAELAAEWRHGLHAAAWLTLRADVALPLDLDPYAPWGVYPRLTFGGGFGW